MSWQWVVVLLALGSVLGLLAVAFAEDWVGKPRPKQHIQVSPLLMNPSTNKYAVMNKMRAVAEEHRSRSKDIVIFPEGNDEDGA